MSHSQLRRESGMLALQYKIEQYWLFVDLYRLSNQVDLVALPMPLHDTYHIYTSRACLEDLLYRIQQLGVPVPETTIETWLTVIKLRERCADIHWNLPQGSSWAI